MKNDFFRIEETIKALNKTAKQKVKLKYSMAICKKIGNIYFILKSHYSNDIILSSGETEIDAWENALKYKTICASCIKQKK